MSAASETSDTLHADPPAATRTKRKRGQAAEAKARAAAAKLADQQQRGKFARQEILMIASKGLAETAYGERIVGGCRADGFDVATVDDESQFTRTKSTVHCIRWVHRKRVGPNSIAAHDGVAKTDALILRIFEAKQFMKLMEHTGLEGVVADYAEFQSCLPANSRVVYLILNAHAYYSRRRTSIEAAPTTLAELNAITTELFARKRLECQFITGEPALVKYCSSATLAVAEAPYKASDIPAPPNFLRSITVLSTTDESGATVKPSAGVLLQDAWRAMLQCIPGVSAAKADNIVKRFGSLHECITAYNDPRFTREDKIAFLEREIQPGRKSTLLAARICDFMSALSADDEVR